MSEDAVTLLPDIEDPPRYWDVLLLLGLPANGQDIRLQEFTTAVRAFLERLGADGTVAITAAVPVLRTSMKVQAATRNAAVRIAADAADRIGGGHLVTDSASALDG